MKPPLLMRSGLTGRVYIVTAYKELPGSRVEARTKHDVTEQFHALVLDVVDDIDALRQWVEKP